MSEPSTQDGDIGPGLQRLVAMALGIVVVAHLGVRLWAPHFSYVLWSDRDLMRTLELASTWPTSGAELSFGGGGRIPGGAVHLLLAPAVWLDPDPLTAYRWMVLLDALAMLVLYLGIARSLGPLTAAVTVAAYATSELVLNDLTRLWNPGFVPLFAATAWVATLGGVLERDARWAPVAALGVAFGAQMHMTMGLLGLTLLPAWLLARPAGWRRGLAWSAAAVLVAYAPYLADEAVHGWPNTGLLLRQPQSGVEVAQVLSFSTGSAVDAFTWFAGTGFDVHLLRQRGPAAMRVLDVVNVALGAAPVVVAALLPLIAWRRGWQDSTRAAAVAFSSLLIALTWYGFDPTLHIYPQGSRYLQAWMPGAALMAGVVAHGLVREARPLALLVVVMLGVPALAGGHRMVRGAEVASSWQSRATALRAIEAETGWALADIAGRTVLMRRSGDRWIWAPEDGIDYLLALRGESFRGSSPAPCAIWFDGGARSAKTPDWPDEAMLSDWLERDVPGLRILDRTRLGRGDLLVRYASDEPCATSMAQRYVHTPVEALLHARFHDLPVGEPVDVAAGFIGRRVLLALDLGPGHGETGRVVLALDLARAADGLTVTLHANQLRGKAYNRDSYTNVMARDVLVTLEGPEVREVPLASLAGWKAALTPLSRQVVLPDGRWRVRLSLALETVGEIQGALDGFEGVRFDVDLGEIELGER